LSFHAINAKQKKQLLAALSDAFGYDIPFEYAVFLSGPDKYYFATRDVEQFFDAGLRIERIGVYVGQFQHGEFRLTIEGSQLIGPHATRRVLHITPEQRGEWMLGKDLILVGEQTEAEAMFHIVRCEDDFLGCGKVKNGILLNYVPKERYVGAVFTDDDLVSD
jgi:NOL1/NOP2/fmu family ribosome biogenesis protein